jgi:hypothetical protein
MMEVQYARSSLMEAQHGRAPGDQPTVAEEGKSSGVLVYPIGLLLAVICLFTFFYLMGVRP